MTWEELDADKIHTLQEIAERHGIFYYRLEKRLEELHLPPADPLYRSVLHAGRGVDGLRALLRDYGKVRAAPPSTSGRPPGHGQITGAHQKPAPMGVSAGHIAGHKRGVPGRRIILMEPNLLAGLFGLVRRAQDAIGNYEGHCGAQHCGVEKPQRPPHAPRRRPGTEVLRGDGGAPRAGEAGSDASLITPCRPGCPSFS